MMKYNPMAKLRLLLLPVFFLVLACNKENPGLNLKEDKTKPSINAVSPVNSSGTYANGQQIHFKSTLTDNRGVESYRIKIEFDQKRNESAIHGTPWFFFESYKASGRSAEVTQTIPVAQNALAGPYRMVIFCKDIHDNEADSVVVLLNIYNTNDMLAPTFTDNFTGSNAHLTISLATDGNSITVLDTIQDNDRLTLVKADGYNNRTKVKLPMLPFDINLIAQGSTNRYFFEQTLFFPDTGRYTFTLSARDVMNNTGVKTIGFTIVP